MLENGGYKDFRMAQAMYYYLDKPVSLTSKCRMFFVKGRRTDLPEMALDQFS
jgi:hypothetical protein